MFEIKPLEWERDASVLTAFTRFGLDRYTVKPVGMGYQLEYPTRTLHHPDIFATEEDAREAAEAFRERTYLRCVEEFVIGPAELLMALAETDRETLFTAVANLDVHAFDNINAFSAALTEALREWS